jgi:uncharacterized protein YfaS (alpha-2-macroglobulin family)
MITSGSMAPFFFHFLSRLRSKCCRPGSARHGAGSGRAARAWQRCCGARAAAGRGGAPSAKSDALRSALAAERGLTSAPAAGAQAQSALGRQRAQRHAGALYAQARDAAAWRNSPGTWQAPRRGRQRAASRWAAREPKGIKAQNAHPRRQTAAASPMRRGRPRVALPSVAQQPQTPP